MCVVWIFIFAAELVALLEAVGQITGVPNGVMGLTVLAWGNSIGDTFSNISVAKSGHAGGIRVG
jgi:sodium/potassium/calcium exchanger 6